MPVEEILCMVSGNNSSPAFYASNQQDPLIYFEVRV